MKIKCKVSETNIGTNRGILVEIFETDNKIKKTFKKNLSEKNREALEILLDELYCNIKKYTDLFETVGEDRVIEELKTKFTEQFNTYQSDNIKMLVKDIALPIMLNKTTILDSETIKSRYDLDEEDDLLVAIIGNFGYGKTTLIKKILRFDDSYKFLLVDNGRTTIYNTIIRGLITFKDGDASYVLVKDEIGNTKKIKLEDYKFKNKIILHDSDYIYSNVITINLNNAFNVYCKLKSNKELTLDNKTLKEKTLEEFIKNSKCNLDSLFGSVEMNDNTFYNNILNEFDKIVEKYDEIDNNVNFANNETLIKAFNDFYNKSISDVISINEEYQQSETKKTEIKFYLNSTQVVENIDDFYIPFTDNSIRGGGLRLLVKEIYLETDLDVTEFVNNDGEQDIPVHLFNDIKDMSSLKYHSIVFTDTVGCSHQQSNTEGDTGLSKDIIANSGLLNESDLIMILEKSTNTMTTDIKSQIFTLENLGFKKKTLICYSYYNQFIKLDIHSDLEREYELDKHLKGSIDTLYSNNPTKGVLLYNNFSSELSDYDKNKQIIYLKGLVPRADKQVEIKNTQTSIRSKSNNNNIDISNAKDNEHAKQLNANFEDCNNCLSELINKMVLISEEIKKLKNSTFSIENKSTNENFAVEYHKNVYPEFLKNCLAKQRYIYTSIIPYWNTTECLCYNAFNKNDAKFYGTTINLTPTTDIIGVITEKISIFLDTIDFIEVQMDEEGELIDKTLREDFLIDQIKGNFNQKVTEFFNIIICTTNKSEWKRLYFDSGNGITIRRSEDIFKLLENSINKDSVKDKVLELLRSSIHEVLDLYSIQY